jgi:hypothetical protein
MQEMRSERPRLGTIKARMKELRYHYSTSVLIYNRFIKIRESFKISNKSPDELIAQYRLKNTIEPEGHGCSKPQEVYVKPAIF